MISKIEYETMMRLIYNNEIDELKDYLNSRVNGKHINSIEKAILSLIKDDCIKKYPSYAKRMSGNSSVLIKQYNGYCIESDKGCIICHKNSNIIELYDRRFISQDTIDLLTKNTLNNYPLEKYISLIMKFNEVFNLYSNVDEMTPVSYTTKENKYINIYDNNKNYITMPELYYDVFEELLGFPEAGYITSDKKALYMKSEKGRALILRNRRKDDCLYE